MCRGYMRYFLPLQGDVQLAQLPEQPPQPHEQPPLFLRFLIARSASTAQTASSRRIISVVICPPPYSSCAAENTTNDTSHATQHCVSAMVAARSGEPTSRRMAAMAATQGV